MSFFKNLFLFIPSHFLAILFPWLKISHSSPLQKRDYGLKNCLKITFQHSNDWILASGWCNFWKRKLRWGASVWDLPRCNRGAKTTRVWP